MTHLFYALGGGLGHVTRSLAVIQTLRINEPATMLVSPHIADWDLSLPDHVTLECLPEKLIKDGHGTRLHLESLLRHESPENLWLDAFPFGLFGELEALPNINTHHVARILQEGSWMTTRQNARFATTFVVESLSHNHFAYLQHHSENMQLLHLEEELPAQVDPGHPFTLLIHSGKQAEVDRLLSICPPECPVLASVNPNTSLPDDVVRIPAPQAYLASASQIISGAGFNTMRETMPFREKHHAIAFERRFDDQEARLKLVSHLRSEFIEKSKTSH